MTTYTAHIWTGANATHATVDFATYADAQAFILTGTGARWPNPFDYQSGAREKVLTVAAKGLAAWLDPASYIDPVADDASNVFGYITTTYAN